MKIARSLHRRLGLSLGIVLAILWLSAASVTAVLVRHSMEDVFDSALQETAQRILPLAVADILSRDEESATHRLAEISHHDEFLTYIVRDNQGRILLQSHGAVPELFLPWQGLGFQQSATHRFYNEDTLQNSVRITVAAPLARRQAMAREVQLILGLPLLIFLPVALLASMLIVRISLIPLRRFRDTLAVRGANDLSLVPANQLPAEIVPVANTLNGLLKRLSVAFEAERSFTANAAHELRTPLAGAIAQVQRLQSEVDDVSAKARAVEIEVTLKRLTRLSERLMQLARAEGGRLRLEKSCDLRLVARILTDELLHADGAGRLRLNVPETPLMSDMDPDIFAIVYRNLVENALRHGSGATKIEVELTSRGMLRVSNDGPTLPASTLARLTERFERANVSSDGCGLGLAIVHTIVQRLDSTLVLKSPRTGSDSGFEATIMLPVIREHPLSQ